MYVYTSSLRRPFFPLLAFETNKQVGQRCWDAFKNIGRFLALGLVAGGILLAILLGA